VDLAALAALAALGTVSYSSSGAIVAGWSIVVVAAVVISIVICWRPGAVVISIVINRSIIVVVTTTIESIVSAWEEYFIDDVNDTITGDDILTEGILLIGASSIIFVHNKVILVGELINKENIAGDSDGWFEAVHNITGPNLL
jgi:hypothetical protein